MQDALQLLLVEPSAEIDWDSIEIENRWEEEGRQEIASEHAIYVQLGLEKEDESEKKRRERACNTNAGSNLDDGLDDYVAAMPCEDIRDDETRRMHDKRNPVMKVGSLYPSM